MLRYRFVSGRRIDLTEANSRAASSWWTSKANQPGGQLPIRCITCLPIVLGLAEKGRKLPFGEGRWSRAA